MNELFYAIDFGRWLSYTSYESNAPGCVRSLIKLATDQPISVSIDPKYEMEILTSDGFATSHVDEVEIDPGEFVFNIRCLTDNAADQTLDAFKSAITLNSGANALSEADDENSAAGLIPDDEEESAGVPSEVSTLIRDYIRAIQNGVYGEEVRTAIWRSISALGSAHDTVVGNMLDRSQLGVDVITELNSDVSTLYLNYGNETLALTELPKSIDLAKLELKVTPDPVTHKSNLSLWYPVGGVLTKFASVELPNDVHDMVIKSAVVHPTQPHDRIGVYIGNKLLDYIELPNPLQDIGLNLDEETGTLTIHDNKHDIDVADVVLKLASVVYDKTIAFDGTTLQNEEEFDEKGTYISYTNVLFTTPRKRIGGGLVNQGYQILITTTGVYSRQLNETVSTGTINRTKWVGKKLSDNNFTDSLKTKLEEANNVEFEETDVILKLVAEDDLSLAAKVNINDVLANKGISLSTSATSGGTGSYSRADTSGYLECIHGETLYAKLECRAADTSRPILATYDADKNYLRKYTADQFVCLDDHVFIAHEFFDDEVFFRISRYTLSNNSTDHAVCDDYMHYIPKDFPESVTNGILTPRMFNAVGDGTTDDYRALQAMFDLAYLYSMEIYFPKNKEYRATSAIILRPYNAKNLIAGVDEEGKAVVNSASRKLTYTIRSGKYSVSPNIINSVNHSSIFVGANYPQITEANAYISCFTVKGSTTASVNNSVFKRVNLRYQSIVESLKCMNFSHIFESCTIRTDSTIKDSCFYSIRNAFMSTEYDYNGEIRSDLSLGFLTDSKVINCYISGTTSSPETNWPSVFVGDRCDNDARLDGCFIEFCQFLFKNVGPRPQFTGLWFNHCDIQYIYRLSNGGLRDCHFNNCYLTSFTKTNYWAKYLNNNSSKRFSEEIGRVIEYMNGHEAGVLITDSEDNANIEAVNFTGITFNGCVINACDNFITLRNGRTEDLQFKNTDVYVGQMYVNGDDEAGEEDTDGDDSGEIVEPEEPIITPKSSLCIQNGSIVEADGYSYVMKLAPKTTYQFTKRHTQTSIAALSKTGLAGSQAYTIAKDVDTFTFKTGSYHLYLVWYVWDRASDVDESIVDSLFQSIAVTKQSVTVSRDIREMINNDSSATIHVVAETIM